jgi:addiction module RelE/StbE family toxin
LEVVRLRYTRQALADLEEARTYIAERNPEAAAAMALRIRDASDGLRLFPNRGRQGRIGGTRELVIRTTPFVVAYRITDRQVEVLAIIHGARRWPGAF